MQLARGTVVKYIPEKKKTVVKTVVMYSPFLSILCQVLSFHFYFHPPSLLHRFILFYFIFFIFGLKFCFYVISFFYPNFYIRHPPSAIPHLQVSGPRFTYTRPHFQRLH